MILIFCISEPGRLKNDSKLFLQACLRDWGFSSFPHKKQVTQINWFPSAYKSYVYTIL